jgi:hypothetical protein
MNRHVSGMAMWARLGAIVAIALAVNAFSQELVTAYVPIKADADAAVSIQPENAADGERGAAATLAAGVEQTLAITFLAGEASSVTHGRQQRAGVQPSASYSRGNVSLALPPQSFGDAEISLFSINGRRVLRGKAAANGAKLSRPNIPAGVYLLSAKGANGSSFSYRLNHRGGAVNINVSFRSAGGSLYKGAESAAAVAAGGWIINAADAAGGNTLALRFIPIEGMNPLQEITLKNNVSITFGGQQAAVNNPFAGNGVAVTVNGQHVTVNAAAESASREVNYVLSGSAGDGSFKIYSDYKFGLIFNGASITNPSGPAVNIQSGKRVAVTLAGNTANNLADGADYRGIPAGEDAKAAFFSEGQLIFGGGGSLSVNGNYRHAICSDDWIQINGGSITLASASDGIHANDRFEMTGGAVTIADSKSDGIDVERGNVSVSGGTIAGTVSGQAGKGIKSSGDIEISGGSIDFKITGNAYHNTEDSDNKSPAGIKSDGDMAISGNPAIKITASGSAGKGINAVGALTVGGGTIDITTSGAKFCNGTCPSNNNPGGPMGGGRSVATSSAKAVKSQGDLTINGGRITVKTSTDGAEGIESKAKIVINDGYIMVESYDDAINSANTIAINGGEIYCNASNNDGIDANGRTGEVIAITGGTVVTFGSGSPEGGIDCDSYTFAIKGGTVVSFGGAASGGMATSPSASASTQRSVIWNTSGSLASGLLIGIRSASGGADLLNVRLPKAYSAASGGGGAGGRPGGGMGGSSGTGLIFSSPNLQAGAGYTIHTGGDVSGGSEVFGYYTGAASSGGTQAAAFTASSMIVTAQ